MRWSAEALLAIARRMARLAGAHADDALPVVRTRDRRLIGVYIRDRGWVRA